MDGECNFQNCFKFYGKISLFLWSVSSPCLRQYFVDVNILVPMVEQALARYKCDANTAVRFKLGKRYGLKTYKILLLKLLLV